MLIVSTLPNETFYSRLIRFRLVNGLSLASMYRYLFGKRKVRIHSYLPAHLDVLSKSGFGDIDDILYMQTLFPYYEFFLPQQALKIRSAMLANNGAKVLHEALFSMLKGRHPYIIKSCENCAKSDIERFGVSYWHRDHQIPGITACGKHGSTLIEFKLGDDAKFYAISLPKSGKSQSTASPREQEIANFSKILLSNLIQPRKRSNLRNILLEKLAQNDFLTPSGSVRRTSVMNEFSKYYTDLPERAFTLLPILSKNKSFLHGVFNFRESPVPQQPFKLLMFAAWLYKDPLELILDSQYIRQPSFLSPIANDSTKTNYRTNNIKIDKTCDSKKRKVWRKAMMGIHRENIACCLNVSTGYVEQVISSDRTLVKWRRHIRYRSKLIHYRQKLIEFYKLHPTAKRKDLKTYCNSEYYWIYHFDKYWLDNSLPTPKKVKQNPRVDWKNRDIEAAFIAKKVLSHENCQISRSSLDRKLGDHGWLIKYKDRFPLTMTIFNAHNSSIKI